MHTAKSFYYLVQCSLVIKSLNRKPTHLLKSANGDNHFPERYGKVLIDIPWERCYVALGFLYLLFAHSLLTLDGQGFACWSIRQ